MGAGYGSRTWAKTEGRKSKAAQEETTAAYLAGDLKLTFAPVELLCECRSFHYPHRLSAHRFLSRSHGGEADWRTPEESRIYDRIADLKIYDRELR